MVDNMISENLSGIKHEEKGLTSISPLAMHRKQYSEDVFIRMHYHSSFEINICDNLQGTINIEGKNFELNNMKLIFLPPGTLHSYRVKCCKGSISVWHLGLHLMPLINSDFAHSLFQHHSHQIYQKGEIIKETEKLLSELIKSEGLIRSSGILRLLSLFHNPQQIPAVSAENQFLKKIIVWSETNYRETITLDDAASAVNLSRYHFARKFKKITNSTYIEYLNNLRLENSLKHLNHGCSVSETTEKSGFSDVSYYIKKFREMYNKTPLEYQKSI